MDILSGHLPIVWIFIKNNIESLDPDKSVLESGAWVNGYDNQQQEKGDSHFRKNKSPQYFVQCIIFLYIVSQKNMWFPILYCMKEMLISNSFVCV